MKKRLRTVRWRAEYNWRMSDRAGRVWFCLYVAMVALQWVAVATWARHKPLQVPIAVLVSIMLLWMASRALKDGRLRRMRPMVDSLNNLRRAMREEFGPLEGDSK